MRDKDSGLEREQNVSFITDKSYIYWYGVHAEPVGLRTLSELNFPQITVPQLWHMKPAQLKVVHNREWPDASSWQAEYTQKKDLDGRSNTPINEIVLFLPEDGERGQDATAMEHFLHENMNPRRKELHSQTELVSFRLFLKKLSNHIDRTVPINEYLLFGFRGTRN